MNISFPFLLLFSSLLTQTAWAQTRQWYKGPSASVTRLYQKGDETSFAEDVDRSYYTLGGQGMYRAQAGYTQHDLAIAGDKGFYNQKNGFWDSQLRYSLQRDLKFQQFSGEVTYAEGHDDFGLIRLPLKEQLEFQHYDQRQKNHYRQLAGEMSHRWDWNSQWYSYFFVALKSIDRVQFTKNIFGHYRIYYGLKPKIYTGAGFKAFAQKANQTYQDFLIPHVFVDYEYFPKAKLSLLCGAGKVRTGERQEPSRVYNIAIEHPFEQTEVKAELDQSQTAAQSGVGITEELTAQLKVLHRLNRTYTFAMGYSSVRERMLTEQKVNRDRSELKLALSHHWGKEIFGEKDRFENEAHLLYEQGAMKLIEGGKTYRNSFSLSWSSFL